MGKLRHCRTTGFRNSRWNAAGCGAEDRAGSGSECAGGCGRYLSAEKDFGGQVLGEAFLGHHVREVDAILFSVDRDSVLDLSNGSGGAALTLLLSPATGRSPVPFAMTREIRLRHA